MTQLNIGDFAPDFLLNDQSTNPSKLSDLRGKFVIVYFYPKDDTPGCTIEAKDFTCLNEKFQKKQAIVIGISKDSVVSHQKFKEKYDLNFMLVSDQTGICEQYGVWGEKSFFGKKYMGIDRSSFLISPEGKLLKIWTKVKAENHAEEVLNSF